MATSTESLMKCPTGILGLDEVTEGGLPRGRPTLVAGGAGSGKTLLAMEFLVKGAVCYDEPGVFLAFEETAAELTQNVASLGFDLPQLIDDQKLKIDFVYVERSEIEETGEYDLEGLFIRLNHAIDSIGAKRVVLDTLETLFAGLQNAAVLRAELRRLFRWLKHKGVTAIVTAERGDGRITRHGLEEYVSDCVIVLDHRIANQVATRRLRVSKYRGSAHGTNEYPFLITNRGFDVLPITSVGLDHPASGETVSTGIARLDAMLSGGYYRGSSVLISGTAGTGKSSLAVTMAASACRRGESVLYLAFEESQRQVVRNMRSIGIDLEPWLQNGRLQFHAARSTSQGLEAHLAQVYKMVREQRPHLVVVDPLTNFLTVGETEDVRAMMLRLIDFLKSEGISAVLTSLTQGRAAPDQSSSEISSLIDTWIVLRQIELNGERNYSLMVLKSRGMAHSNQIRELVFTSRGLELVDVYLGADGPLTGSSRIMQEARDESVASARLEEFEQKRRNLERRRAVLQAQIIALQSEAAAEEDELRLTMEQAEALEQQRNYERGAIARRRWADPVKSNHEVEDKPAAEGQPAGQ